MRLHESIQYHRKQHGISQERLAQLAGLDPNHVQKLESGRLPGMTVHTLGRLAGALGVTPDVLLKDVQLNTKGVK